MERHGTIRTLMIESAADDHLCHLMVMAFMARGHSFKLSVFNQLRCNRLRNRAIFFKNRLGPPVSLLPSSSSSNINNGEVGLSRHTPSPFLTFPSSTLACNPNDGKARHEHKEDHGDEHWLEVFVDSGLAAAYVEIG
uniref:Uncharacterized protein n=1 Tax=Oryza meridionalis TaxID=40149 RepID=A0A0E0E2C8_9ORYZ